MAIVPPLVSEQVHRQGARPARLEIWVRAALISIAALVAGVFAVALALDPYQGDRVWLTETHRQLGLPPCTFKHLTGYPCPSCGMTSSFALLIRGDVWHAARANFAGMMLALGCLMFIPWAIACAWRGRLVGMRDFETWLIRGVLGFFVLMFGRWAIVVGLTYLNK